MQALLVKSPNNWDVTEIPVPEIGPDEVLIKVKFAGICHTDLEVLDGSVPQDWVKYPIVPGHEWSGVVEECGDNVKRFRRGDRVVAEEIVRCCQCKYCLEGRTNLCLNTNNNSNLGYTRNGAFAEYISVPQHIVHRLPDSMPLEIGALVEPTSVAVYALRRARTEPGKTVVVVGPGPIGLLTVAMLTFYHPKELVLVGTRDDRLAVGRRLGATSTINIKSEDPRHSLQKIVGDSGVDYVFECAGNKDGVELAFDLCRRGGVVSLMGIMGGGQKVSLSTDDMMFKDMYVSATYAWDAEAWARSIEFLSMGVIDVSPVITHKFDLQEARACIETVLTKKDGVIKALLTF
jgi:2-desacetyl-2-hydroxyethyl bacteriochlorophyllide A dehydrogenase